MRVNDRECLWGRTRLFVGFQMLKEPPGNQMVLVAVSDHWPCRQGRLGPQLLSANTATITLGPQQLKDNTPCSETFSGLCCS